MIDSVFIDSSAWLSYLIPTDSNYSRAVKIFQSFATETKIYTSLFVFDETITKIRRALSQKEADKFFRKLKNLERKKIVVILPVSKNDTWQAMNLLKQYPTPNTLSLTDATNIILTKKHRIAFLFSFDKDFKRFSGNHFLCLP